MNKKILGIVAVAAVVLIGGALILKGGKNTGASNNESKIEITHSLGTTSIEKTPERVVVLDYGALDVLDGLDVEVVGVPKSGKVPEYLSKYKGNEYGDTGTVKEPNLEVINELKPDLIIMAGRMEDYYDKFSEIAPTIFIESSDEGYISDFETNVTRLGDIFNIEDKSKNMISEVKTKVKETKDEVEKLDTNASAIMVNGRAISAFGTQSRFGLLFNGLDFKQADNSLTESTHGQEVTFEYLLEKNPEYIFVIDRNAVAGAADITAQEVMENELTKQTNAYKNGNIVYLNSINWYTVSGGYQSTLGMIQEVKEAIK